jgi:glycosidase
MPLTSTFRSGLLTACLSLPLISCGGGGGDAGTGTAPLPSGPVAVTVSSAAGTTESRLACFKGTADPECNLRLYQVMVEAFADGDPAANYNTGYGTSPHKGDLAGITNALDYIRSTGVNALWLTPIFESVEIGTQDDWTDRLDATGYFASNYFKVDPKFGTDAQFRALVDAAHARGMRVFLDGVFGHYKSNLVASPTGKLPKHGLCTGLGGTSPAGTNQGCADWSDPATVAFFQEVATHWITQYKIDGWRLDQAYQVPAARWATLRQAVATASAATSYTGAGGATVQPLGHLVAEVWSGEGDIASRAYGTTAAPALTSAFDFPGRYRLVQTLAGEEDLEASRRFNLPATTLAEGYDTYDAYPDHARPNLMLTNHDLVRFGDLIQRAGLGNPDQDSYWLRHKAAFAYLAAHSGPVTLYYGDEIGQEVANFAGRVGNTTCAAAGLCDDHVSRSAGKTTGLTPREADLHAHVAALMALRDTNPALAVGSRTHVYSDRTLYIDRKDAGANRVLFVLNTGTSEATVTVKAEVLGTPGELTDLVAGGTVAAGADGYVITLPALSARFLKF